MPARQAADEKERERPGAQKLLFASLPSRAQKSAGKGLQIPYQACYNILDLKIDRIPGGRMLILSLRVHTGMQGSNYGALQEKTKPYGPAVRQTHRDRPGGIR